MTEENYFTVRLSSGKTVTIDTDFHPHEARFTSPDNTWIAVMKRDNITDPGVILASPNTYPSLSQEETKELENEIFVRGWRAWSQPDVPDFRNPA